jgi:hypothetical protein
LAALLLSRYHSLWLVELQSTSTKDFSQGGQACYTSRP